MQSNNDLSEYKDTMQYLHDVLTFYDQRGKLVVIGDFNARILEDPKYHVAKQKAIAVNDVIKGMNLCVVNNLPVCAGPKYTFRPCETTLDYIITDQTSVSNIIRRSN